MMNRKSHTDANRLEQPFSSPAPARASILSSSSTTERMVVGAEGQPSSLSPLQHSSPRRWLSIAPQLDALPASALHHPDMQAERADEDQQSHSLNAHSAPMQPPRQLLGEKLSLQLGLHLHDLTAVPVSSAERTTSGAGDAALPRLPPLGNGSSAGAEAFRLSPIRPLGRGGHAACPCSPRGKQPQPAGHVAGVLPASEVRLTPNTASATTATHTAAATATEACCRGSGGGGLCGANVDQEGERSLSEWPHAPSASAQSGSVLTGGVGWKKNPSTIAASIPATAPALGKPEAPCHAAIPAPAAPATATATTAVTTPPLVTHGQPMMDPYGDAALISRRNNVLNWIDRVEAARNGEVLKDPDLSFAITFLQLAKARALAAAAAAEAAVAEGVAAAPTTAPLPTVTAATQPSASGSREEDSARNVAFTPTRTRNEEGCGAPSENAGTLGCRVRGGGRGLLNTCTASSMQNMAASSHRLISSDDSSAILPIPLGPLVDGAIAVTSPSTLPLPSVIAVTPTLRRRARGSTADVVATPPPAPPPHSMLPLRVQQRREAWACVPGEGAAAVAPLSFAPIPPAPRASGGIGGEGSATCTSSAFAVATQPATLMGITGSGTVAGDPAGARVEHLSPALLSSELTVAPMTAPPSARSASRTPNQRQFLMNCRRASGGGGSGGEHGRHSRSASGIFTQLSAPSALPLGLAVPASPLTPAHSLVSSLLTGAANAEQQTSAYRAGLIHGQFQSYASTLDVIGGLESTTGHHLSQSHIGAHASVRSLAASASSTSYPEPGGHGRGTSGSTLTGINNTSSVSYTFACGGGGGGSTCGMTLNSSHTHILPPATRVPPTASSPSLIDSSVTMAGAHHSRENCGVTPLRPLQCALNNGSCGAATFSALATAAAPASPVMWAMQQRSSSFSLAPSATPATATPPLSRCSPLPMQPRPPGAPRASTVPNSASSTPVPVEGTASGGGDAGLIPKIAGLSFGSGSSAPGLPAKISSCSTTPSSTPVSAAMHAASPMASFPRRRCMSSGGAHDGAIAAPMMTVSHVRTATNTTTLATEGHSHSHSRDRSCSISNSIIGGEVGGYRAAVVEESPAIDEDADGADPAMDESVTKTPLLWRAVGCLELATSPNEVSTRAGNPYPSLVSAPQGKCFYGGYLNVDDIDAEANASQRHQRRLNLMSDVAEHDECQEGEIKADSRWSLDYCRSRKL